MKNVQINNTAISIPTYEMLGEDLNPVFDKRLDPYPYTMQNYKSQHMTDRVYQTVVIENEYIKMTVIPELGGRLYSAYDKINKREMFYRNPVIKPRMIGTRGAWISGGVEFNFPISHSPNTMSRVNYMTKTYEDGSASIIFGNIEMMSHMHWKIELRLYPGKMYIEENVMLYNPTSYENRFYFWTNAAVEYNENVKLIYPFDWCINNKSTEYIKWPYYKGINCSDPKEIPSSFEVFGKLMAGKFFGVYDNKSDYGVVHYADNKKVKGAKFFIWGNDGRSVAWNRALTDDQSKYLEIQSGLYETQAVFKFLQPYQEAAWSEYWYPVSGTDGFKYAEKELALNYSFIDNGLKFDLISMADIGDCSVDINVNGTSQKTKVCVKAGIPVTIIYNGKVSGMQEPDLHVEVYGDLCKHILRINGKLRFNEDMIDADLYEDSRILPDPKDNNKLFKKAVNSESTGDMEEAFNLYIKNLEENNKCTLTLNRLGRLYLRKDMYKEAQDCFYKVLQYDNRNSEARFLYAVAEKEKGNIRNAYRIFSDISFGSPYFKASVIEMVKTDIMLGYYTDAVELLDSAAKEENNYILFLKSICFRKAGFDDKAQNILKNTVQKDEFLSAEEFLVCRSEIGEKAFLDYICCDKGLLLCISLQYAELGLPDDAKAILNLCSGNGIKTELLNLWVSREKEDWNEKWSEAILQASLDYEFVNEKLIARILVDNCNKDSSGRLDYLLGNYRYWQGRKEDALKHFIKAYSKGLRYTVLLRNIAYIEHNYKNDIETAEKFLEEDVFVNNSLNEYSLLQLDRIYKDKTNIGKRKILLQYLEKVRNRSWIVNVIVDILKDAGMEEKALEILEAEQFENWEGREVSGALYREVILSIVKRNLDKGNVGSAKEWIEKVQLYPDNINYGETIYTCLSDVHYYKGLVYSLSGMHKEAEQEFRKGACEYDCMKALNSDACQAYSIKCIRELQKRL